MALVAIMGVLGGAAGMGTIAILSQALAGSTHIGPFDILLPFVFTAIMSQAMRATSNWLSARIDWETYRGLEERIIRQVLEIPLSNVEQIGGSRILANLTTDVNSIAQSQMFLVWLLINGTVVAGALSYIAWLSLTLFGFVVGSLAVFVLPVYFALDRILTRKWQLERNRSDDQLSCIRGLLEGIKELKLNAKRRDAFQQRGSGEAIRQLVTAGTNARDWLNVELIWVDLCTMGIMATLVFVAPLVAPIDSSELRSAVLAYLWAIGAFSQVVATFPMLGRARAARAAVRELLNCTVDAARDVSSGSLQNPSVEHGIVEVKSATYRFQSTEGEEGFSVGPVTLEFKPGEIVFICGGNGSGKTTFAKMLAGLYTPTSGVIRAGGADVTDATRDAYRQGFSAVFQEFHVFDTLLGFEDTNIDETANRILARLGLSGKVKIEKGRLSTLSLSRGQMKRLALSVVLLEDRPFCVLDEWAADQDPAYREIFYREIVPEFRARNKCLVAISHDDRYYDLADRIVRFEDGRVVEVHAQDRSNPKPVIARR